MRLKTIAIRTLVAAGVVLALALVRDPRPAGGPGARIAFYRARAAGRSTYPAWAGLGAAYYLRARGTGSARDYAEAERALRQSLAYQRNAEALKWQAATLADQHRFAEALPLAREAVDAAGSDVDARGILFDVLLGMPNAGEAEPVLKAMLAHPSKPGPGCRPGAGIRAMPQGPCRRWSRLAGRWTQATRRPNRGPGATCNSLRCVNAAATGCAPTESSAGRRRSWRAPAWSADAIPWRTQTVLMDLRGGLGCSPGRQENLDR